MKFKSGRISWALLFAAIVPATIALPLAKSHPTSGFEEAIERFAELLAKEAEKEFGSVPNGLGEGRSIGLVNILVGTKGEGTKVYWRGKEIVPVEKEYL